MTRNLILLKSIIPEAPMNTKVADLICDDCRDDISIMTVTKDDLHHSPSNLERIMHRHKMKTSLDEKKRMVILTLL